MLQILYILLLIGIFSIGGCESLREHLSSEEGRVKIGVSIPWGKKNEAPYKEYFIVEGKIIDRRDTSRTVRRKLGKPHTTGKTLEGYDFWRYEDKKVEIYFDGKRVVGWSTLEFRP